ncbi:MAG TPA: HAD-IA family hydrolase [Vicinamibacterales bacterium]
MQALRTPAAVLFDLDDTLFDHAHAARAALTRVHAMHDCFASGPFDAFEEAHVRCLEALHQRVLAGAMGIDEARLRRFRQLFANAGVDASDDHVAYTASTYRAAYLEARRPIEGARDLLAALKPRVRIGVVSNNILEEQRAKVRLCGFDPYIDALVVSEEAGFTKPDPRIFEVALGRLGCEARDAVMIGDSWAADVEGARAAGVRAIWFNRTGRPVPDADGAGADVDVIDRLTPVDDVLRILDPALRCA